MTRTELINNIRKKSSFLCVGLDSDITKIPQHLLKYEDPIFEFNKQIIDATHKYCVAYKPNTAFYESLGAKGWESLKKTIEYIPEDIFVIADAKRGDIGNTSKLYAKAFFEELNCDAVTVAPYMGEDSVKPFLEYKNKWVILLALTSNKGALDFQLNQVKDVTTVSHNYLFEDVLEKSSKWGTPENLMYVVGATRGELIQKARKVVPDNFLLIPGVGAQGGSIEDIEKYALNKDIGVLVNSSRSIIYASNDENFAKKAGEEALKFINQIEKLVIK
jgi:orotidine-5'-phosphate decarboxylase